MLRRLLGAVAASALLIALPVPSHADTYVPTTVDQDFDGSAGGWTASASYGGLCLPQLLCPAATSGYAAGGADGNGYLRTGFSTLVATVAGTTTATWESPAFAYNGAAGAVPASLTFDMNVLQDLGALLGLSVDNTSSYRVDLVDQTNGNAVGVATGPLTPNAGWSAVPSATITPALLTLGREYKIRIETRYTALVTAVASGEVGYDNVRLVATPVGTPPPPVVITNTTTTTTTTTTTVTTGGPTTSNRGSGITTRKELRKLTKSFILPKSAKLSGKNFQLKLRCPAKAAPLPCKIQVEGLSAGKFSKPATARKFVSIKAEKKRLAKIRVKEAYRTAYAKVAASGKQKVWVKATVRVGKLRVTVRQRMLLR